MVTIFAIHLKIQSSNHPVPKQRIRVNNTVPR